MKQKVFDLKPCWFVDGWATEVKPGSGCIFEYANGYYSEEKILFYPKEKDSTPELLSTHKVYFDLKEALRQVEFEKDRYITYLKKQESEAKEKLQELLT